MVDYKLRQVLFLRYKWRLCKHAEEKGLYLAEAEGCLMPQRKSRLHIPFEDGVHMKNSAHYNRMATDFVLYDDTTGSAVTNGDDPRWAELGEFWEGIDPALCRWGGRFNPPDPNHFSVTCNGVS